MGRASNAKRARRALPVSARENVVAPAVCTQCGRVAIWPKRPRQGEPRPSWCCACVRYQKMRWWGRAEEHTGRLATLYPEPHYAQTLAALLEGEAA